ncbi:hypothetical protein SCAR479_13855 [Seiridium cardinale]|uniref:Ribosomal protein L2 n=1 Tax=Seiridium cardinale TaxID=138064 RepID=A0ABR2X6T4_9PEZI
MGPSVLWGTAARVICRRGFPRIKRRNWSSKLRFSTRPRTSRRYIPT